MSDAELRHATLTFERHVPAPVAAVFAAYADAEARAAWGAPSDTAVILYDAADFRVGGVDRFRCGPRTDPKIHGTTWYNDIVVDRRIVSTERIEMDGAPLAVSLSTAAFAPAGEGATRLTVVVQLVSFVGEDMIRGHETGNNGSLDSLVRHFAARAD